MCFQHFVNSNGQLNYNREGDQLGTHLIIIRMINHLNLTILNLFARKHFLPNTFGAGLPILKVLLFPSIIVLLYPDHLPLSQPNCKVQHILQHLPHSGKETSLKAKKFSSSEADRLPVLKSFIVSSHKSESCIFVVFS